MADEVTTDDVDNRQEVDASAQDNTSEQQAEQQDPGYMAAVKADLREKYGDELRKYQNINPIIEDYFTLREKAEKAILKPSEDATEEEVAKYKEAIGIPKEANEYELDDPPEELGKEFQEWFRGLAFESELNKDQAKNLYASLVKLEQDSISKKVEDKANVERELRKELGSDYDSAIANAAKIVELGGDDIKSWLEETGAGNDPRFVKVFSKLGAMISEDAIGQTQATKKGDSLSLAERLYPNQGK